MAPQRPLHVFVMGLDEEHLSDLCTIRNADKYQFHVLLEADEVVFLDDYDIPAMFERAQKKIESADCPIDGIVGHWDFPVTSLVPMLAQKNGLPAPSLESVCKCNHKYWSRIEQKRAIPECTPRFQLFDPFDDDSVSSLDLPYPFWVKPVKGYGSQLGFYIKNEQQLKEAIREIRENISTIGDAFSQLLEMMPVPDEIKEIGGDYCLAEQIIGGRELAPEGCVYEGDVQIHGLIDMPRHRGSFQRYSYPADVPKELERRINETTERILHQIGFDNGCFNVEYFYDEAKDKLWIVEINPRISQSHCYLFEQVNGVSNHQVAVQVATGESPHFEPRKGPYGAAAKCMLRSWEDGRVRRLPDEVQVESLEEQFPGCRIDLHVEEGMSLDEAPEQDSYSSVLGYIYVCGQNEEEMMQRYEQIVEALDIQIETDHTYRKVSV